MCLISVVFPAPFSPTSPMTVPWRSSSDTSSSASLSRKRRVKCETFTSGGAASSPFRASSSANVRAIATMVSVLPQLHHILAFVDQLDQLIQRNVHLFGLGQECVDPQGEDLDALRARESWPDLGNVSACCAAFHHEPGDFQFAVRP